MTRGAARGAARAGVVGALLGVLSGTTSWLVPGSAAGQAGLPASHLAVRRGAVADTFWTSDRAPAAWRAGLPAVEGAVAWRPAADGVRWGQLALTGRGEARAVRLVVAVLSPAAVRPRLVRRRGWTVDDATATALVALNAGQFDEQPWGLVVRWGTEEQPAGRGPLAPILAWDARGRLRWRVPGVTAATAGAWTAFQSYPTLLWDEGDGIGRVPEALQRATPWLDVGHRDARLAIGERRDGTLLVALTRFDGLGDAFEEVAGRLPFGLTTPEMAAVMGGLGCRVAVALDGGASAQLLVRGAGTWRGLRGVPLALEFHAAPGDAGTP